MDSKVIQQSEKLLKEKILMAIAEHEARVEPFQVTSVAVSTIERRTQCGVHTTKFLTVEYNMQSDE